MLSIVGTTNLACILIRLLQRAMIRIKKPAAFDTNGIAKRLIGSMAPSNGACLANTSEGTWFQKKQKVSF